MTSPKKPILQDGFTGEYRPKKRKQVSELDAAMHYIDFQKKNW